MLARQCCNALKTLTINFRWKQFVCTLPIRPATDILRLHINIYTMYLVRACLHTYTYNICTYYIVTTILKDDDKSVAASSLLDQRTCLCFFNSSMIIIKIFLFKNKVSKTSILFILFKFLILERVSKESGFLGFLTTISKITLLPALDWATYLIWGNPNPRAASHESDLHLTGWINYVSMYQ